MKLPSVAALFLAIGYATPLEPRVELPIGVFNVTNFKASSIPHSVWSYANFNISVTTIAPATGCAGEVLSYQRVGSLPVTNCTEPIISFNLTRTPDGGAELGIFWTFAAPGLLKGTYRIPGSLIVISGVGTSVHEDYTGPLNFTVSNLTLLHSVLGD